MSSLTISITHNYMHVVNKFCFTVTYAGNVQICFNSVPGQKLKFYSSEIYSRDVCSSEVWYR